MSEHYGNCPRVGFWDAGEFDAPCTCDGKNTRAPVESVTVSGERKWNRATVNEVGYQLGLAHAEGRVTSRELTHTVEFVLDNAVRVGLVVPAPPLSPATPSAEPDLRAQVFGVLYDATRDRRTSHTGVFGELEPYVDRILALLPAAPATPSVTVETDALERVIAEAERREFEWDVGGQAFILKCRDQLAALKAAPRDTREPSVTVEELARAEREFVTVSGIDINERGETQDGWGDVRAGLKAVLSLPRAPAKETTAVEAEVVERCAKVCDEIANPTRPLRSEEIIRRQRDDVSDGARECARAIRALARAQEGRGT